MSTESIPAPLPEAAASSSPATAAAAASGVGLGYGIAIAVGILVLVSTIMLASYLCVRVKGGPHRSRHPSSSSAAAAAPDPTAATAAAAAAVLGLEGPAVEAYYPKFAYGGNGSGTDESGPCPICLAEYSLGESLRRVAECGHCFHATCVDAWLRVSATCPLCRSSPVPSATATPLSVATPLSELIPLAAHAR